MVKITDTGGLIKNNPLPEVATASPENHILFLDQIRGFAIFIVFAFHCMVTVYLPIMGSAELAWNGSTRDFHAPVSFLALLPLTLGWTGVSIFFVVSGFCIHLSHERSQMKDWRIFFIRRFFRIYPPYLVALLFFAIAFPGTKLLFTHQLIHVHEEWFYSTMQLGVHLLMVHNFSPISLLGINPAFWSIAVEVQLYLLYPLVFLLFKVRSPMQTLWLTGCVEIGLRTIEALYIIHFPYKAIPTWFAYEPLMFWFSWSIGAALAEAYLADKRLPFDHPIFLWPLLLITCYAFRPLDPFCFTFAALSTATVISTLLKHPPSLHKLNPLSRHLRFAGVVSYSAYLIHMPLISAVPEICRHLLPRHHFNAPSLVACCLSAWIPILALAYLMYRFVELPCITYGKLFIRRTLGI